MKRTTGRSAALVLVAFPALLMASCGGGEPGGAGETGAETGESASPARSLEALAVPRRLDATAPDTFRARFETTEGAFVVEVRRAWAPRGADRFYNLVRTGFYDSVYVHRVLPGRVAQFGIHRDPRINYVWKDAIIQDDTVRASNTRGRITYAKSGPNSRTTQVFINLSDNAGLDGDGFAPFGEVVEGMEVVDAFYDGYGDGPPRGEGPYPARALAVGNEYFRSEFPELDLILEARVVGEG
ncbi:MAG TPA: peptidylprolyl isomerase [Longimicrobiales bacterium]|nr:peptidylprolyl isomerase [Longimicrobiales bacterium]